MSSLEECVTTDKGSEGMIYHCDGKTITIKTDDCIGCGACVDICPTGVLEINMDSRKNSAPNVFNCCKCRSCCRVCPVDAITID